MKYTDFNLTKIIQEEENYNFIYGLREEIFENVSRYIDEIEFEKDRIRFVADCAYEAIVKLLTIEFYHHSAMINPLEGGWVMDEPPEPSPPDTWAAKRVTVMPKPKPKVESTSGSECRSCICNFDNECKCFMDREEREKEYIEMVFNTATDLCVEESAEGAEQELEGDDYDEENEDEEKKEEELVQEPVVETKPKPCVLKEGFSKITISRKHTELPKINVLKPIKRPTIPEDIHLPPIRADACFDYRFDVKPESKKKGKRS